MNSGTTTPMNAISTATTGIRIKEESSFGLLYAIRIFYRSTKNRSYIAFLCRQCKPTTSFLLFSSEKSPSFYIFNIWIFSKISTGLLGLLRRISYSSSVLSSSAPGNGTKSQRKSSMNLIGGCLERPSTAENVGWTTWIGTKSMENGLPRRIWWYLSMFCQTAKDGPR